VPIGRKQSAGSKEARKRDCALADSLTRRLADSLLPPLDPRPSSLPLSSLSGPRPSNSASAPVFSTRSGLTYVFVRLQMFVFIRDASFPVRSSPSGLFLCNLAPLVGAAQPIFSLPHPFSRPLRKRWETDAAPPPSFRTFWGRKGGIARKAGITLYPPSYDGLVIQLVQ